jgi:hypothetical protein
MKSSFERLLEPGFVVLFSTNRDEEEVYTAAGDGLRYTNHIGFPLAHSKGKSSVDVISLIKKKIST